VTRTALFWEHHAWESPIRVGGRAFAERFLESGWEIAYLNGPLAIWNLFAGNDEVRRRRRSWLAGGEERRWGSGRLFTYAPLAPIPYRAYPLLRRAWFHRHALDATWPPLPRLLASKGFPRVDLLWLATGSPMLPLLDRVRFGRSLYRLSDETAWFPDTPRSYPEVEEEAMRRVDWVVATAHSLAERARRVTRNVLLLPNGVDLDRFDRARDSLGALPRPEERPRAVYVGAIDSWLDTGVLSRLARALPGADLVLAGPDRVGRGWARDLPNVRHVGPVAPEQVPALLAGSSVGLIPFRDTPLTRAIHPVKIYEYFAAGLPVVATDLEEIRRIGSPALLAATPEQWVDRVREALAAGSRPEYRAFAARHDWKTRFSALMQVLEPRSARPIAQAAGGGR
jgi:hypothetical protein